MAAGILRELRPVLAETQARIIAVIGLLNFLGLLAVFYCVSSSKSMVLTGYAFMILVDLLMLASALASFWVKHQRSTATFSYGYPLIPLSVIVDITQFAKLEVLAVFSTTVLAQLGALFIVKESVERLLDQPSIHTGRFFIGACVALLCHLSVIYVVSNEALKHCIAASSSSWLQEHVSDISQRCKSKPPKENRSSFLVGIFSICSVIPGLSMFLLPRINPLALLSVSGFFICALISILVEHQQCNSCDSFAAIILAVMIIGTMYPLTVYTGKILLQTSPSHVLAQLDKCLSEASTLDGVLEFTNEHFWQLSFGKLAGSIHVRVRRDADEQLVLAHVTDKLSAVVCSLTVQIVKDVNWHTINRPTVPLSSGSSYLPPDVMLFSPATQMPSPPNFDHGHSHSHGACGHGHSH